MTFHTHHSHAILGLPGLAAEFHHAQVASGHAVPLRRDDQIRRTARVFDRPQSATGDPAALEVPVRGRALGGLLPRRRRRTPTDVTRAA